ncbi:MAG: hypothetical protein HOP06_04835 [Methylotenera sp.]|nr:hypothetical protein [Methylotenera sp.]
MYSRFWNLWSENTGIKDGVPTAKTRLMSESEKLEAQDCLKKADELNSCSAIHVLELFYRFGVGDELGIKKDTVVADKYLERKKLLCSQAGLTHHSSGTPKGAP